MFKDCVFCKIIKGEIKAVKIWESREFLAILDVNPNTKGMALVMPKKHYGSYVFDMPEKIYERFMKATKKVAKILENGLNVKRVAMVMEGTGVDHAHIKLYPLHGLKSKSISQSLESKRRVFFNKYKGYISTQLGPAASLAELEKIARLIKKKTEIN